jgi:hypothetical protein
MGEPAPKLPLGGPQRAGAAGPPAALHKAASPEQAASFKALLDRLEQKAEALDAKAHGELAPEELAQAVDEARSSLEDVLALQDRLLEAWRQSKHQASAQPDVAKPRGKGPA